MARKPRRLFAVVLTGLFLGLLLAQFPLLQQGHSETAIVTIANDSANGASSLATEGGQKLIEDSFGKLIAVYVDSSGRLAVTYSNANPSLGGSWAVPSKSPSPTFSYSKPAGVVASPTSLRIIVQGGTGPLNINDQNVTVQRDASQNIVGVSFGNSTELDGSGKARHPAATIAHNGDILAAWNWENGNSSLVKTLRWRAGTGWMSFNGVSTLPDDAIVDSTDDEIFPSIIQRRDNRNVYLIGNRQESNPSTTLVFNKATFDGSNWSWGSQNLNYESNAARGISDSTSLTWDPVRNLVVAAYDVSDTTIYGVFTLDAVDQKVHIFTPSLIMTNNEWGSIEVDETTGDYYLFTMDTSIGRNHGMLGYTKRVGGVWNATLTILDATTNNVAISVKRIGSSTSIDLLYTRSVTDSVSQLRFVRISTGPLPSTRPSDLTVSAQPNPSNDTGSITISGMLTDGLNGTGLQGRTVMIEHSLDQSNWLLLSQPTAGASGSYQASVTFPPGTYYFRAIFPGDVAYAPSVSATYQQIVQSEFPKSYAIVGDEDGKVYRLLDGTGEGLELIGQPTTSPLRRVAWRPGGAYALVVGQAATLLRYDGNQFTEVATGLPSSVNLLASAWKPDGSYALIAGSSGTVMKYDGVSVATVLSPVTVAIRSISWRPNSTSALLVGDEGTMLVYDNDLLVPFPSGTSSALHATAWNPNGQYALVAGANGTILRHNGISNTAINTTGIYQPSHVVLAIGWNSTGNIALLSGQTSLVLTYDGSVLSRLTVPNSLPSPLPNLYSLDWSAWWASIVGGQGTVLKFSGSTLKHVSSSVTSSLRAIDWTEPTPGLDNRPPSQPQNLAATATGVSRIDVSWTMSEDNVAVWGYDVFRNGVKVATLAGALTSYSDIFVVLANTYTYYVVAFDAEGNRSIPSEPLSVMILFFSPTDDATIRLASPNNNYGFLAELEVDNSPVDQFLVKFNVTGITAGTVTSARVRLHNTNGSPKGGNFYTTASASWTEISITWNTAPANQTLVASLGKVSPGNWYEVDITSTVTDNGIVSLRVSSTSSDGADYSSRQGANPPELLVTVVDKPPQLASIGNKAVAEETQLRFNATATDPDNDLLSFSLGPSVPAGVALTLSGVFSWTPSETQGPGSYPVNVIVSDGVLADSETITVTVSEVNKPPVLSLIGDRAVNEGETLSLTVSATDPDMPANTITLSVLGNASGSSFNLSTGAFTWTPNEAQGPGDYVLNFTATDNGSPSMSSSVIVTIHVNETNEPPVLSPVGNKVVDEETLLSFNVTATDSDVPPNVLTFSLASGSPPGALITADGVFSWTPDETQGPGNFTVTIVVTDGTGNNSETITITVNEVNRAPALAIQETHTLDEGAPFSFTVNATDPDSPPNTITRSVSGLPAGSTFNPSTGVFTWTPDEAQGPGTYAINFTVTDDGVPSLSDSRTVIISVNEVNQSPVLSPISDQAVQEEILLSLNLTATDFDIPANTLTFSLGGSVPQGATIDPVTGVFSWTPSEAQGPGVYTVNITVADNGSPPLFDTRSVTITVSEVNQAPVLSPISNKIIDEGLVLSLTASASDPDLPSNVLTFSLGGGAPSGAFLDPATGAFDWTPSEGQGPGSYNVTIIVTDTNGASASQWFTIMVSEVNAPPSLTGPGTFTVDEATLVSFNVTTTDPDVPANAVTLSASGLPQGATFDVATGAFSWTPSEEQGPGRYVLNFTATDNGSPSMSSSVIVTIHVNEVNQQPVLDPVGNKVADEGTLLSFNVTATDPDVPQQSLTLSLRPDSPQGASISPDGRFSWIPSEVQGPGNFTLTILVSDGAASSNQTFTVTVNEVNSSPSLVVPNGQTVSEETRLTFTVSATDADIPSNSITLSVSGLPLGANFDAVNGFFSWVPDEAQGPGTYSVNFTATDNGSPPLSVTMSVSIRVIEINRPPSLSAVEPQTIPEQVVLTFNATASDPDIPANTLTFALAGSIPDGAAIDPSTGTFNWTPSEIQGPGLFTVTITVTDGALLSSRNVTITVTEVNSSPVLSPIGELTVDEETNLNFTAIASDGDYPVQTLVFSITNASTGVFAAGATMAVDGSFSWNPSEGQGPGNYTARISVADGNATSFQDITITVSETNKAPVIADIGGQTVNEGETLTFTLNVTDTDIPANVISFSATSLPVGATFDPVTGMFSWAPDESQGPGDYSMNFTAADNGSPSLSASITVSIHVNEVNQAPVLDAIGNRTVDEGTLLTFNATATDPDIPANTLVLSLSNDAPLGASMTGDGMFSWTPTEDQGPGSYQVTIIVTDGSESDNETITLTVNEVNTPPVLTVPGSQTIDEAMALNFAVTASDFDLPANSIDISATHLPAGAEFDPIIGVFTWTPDEADGPGTFTITFTAADNGTPALTDSKNVTITVNEVNGVPILEPIPDKTVNEESLTAFQVNATDADLPSQVLTFSLEAGAPAGANIDPATGIFTWTPSEAQGPGTYNATVTVTDESGTFSSQTFAITVAEVNRPPVLAVASSQTIDEGSLLAFNVTATDPDHPAQSLTLSLVSMPGGASFDLAKGAFSWIPDEAQGPGAYTATFQVSDGSLIDKKNVTITVNEANQTPTLAQVSDQNVDELTTLTMVPTVSDPDLPAQTLSYSSSGNSSGASVDPATGVISWTPTEAQGPGVYVLTLTVTDSFGASASQSFNITVAEVNASPQIGPLARSQTVPVGSTLSFTVTASDSDEPSNTVLLSASGLVLGMTFDPATGTFTFAPDAGQDGMVFTLTFTATDNGTPALSDRKEVTIGVGVPALAGDVNGDCVVNIIDLSLAGAAFGSTSSSPSWNAAADLNKDGVVDIRDLAVIGSNFGRVCT